MTSAGFLSLLTAVRSALCNPAKFLNHRKGYGEKQESEKLASSPVGTLEDTSTPRKHMLKEMRAFGSVLMKYEYSLK